MEEKNTAEETVKDNILAVCKLISVKMFVGLDITKPIHLSSEELFSVVNGLLKDNYQYTICKFSWMFMVIKTMKNVAGDYGVELIVK